MEKERLRRLGGIFVHGLACYEFVYGPPLCWCGEKLLVAAEKVEEHQWRRRQNIQKKKWFVFWTLGTKKHKYIHIYI